MDLNDTESTRNVSSNIRSVFYCAETPNFTWNLNVTTYVWSLFVIRCIMSPCNILANILVIITMKKKKVLKKQSTILLSSMAVTDLLTGVVCIPSSATVNVLILRQVSFAHICALDSLNMWFSDFLSICSLYHLTVIAWERYVAIRKWMDYKVIVTTSRVKKLAIAGWLSTVFLTVPVLVMRRTGVDHTVVESWYMGQGVLGGILLILLVYFYVMVYLGVRKRKINQISQVTALVKAKLESKVAKTTGLITAVVIFSFIPGGFVWLFWQIFPVLSTNSGFRSCEAIAYLNSLMNPLIYCYRDRRFRNAVLELVKWRKPKAIQPAVVGARSVKRKVPRSSLGDVLGMKMAGKRTRLLRLKSCDSALVLDCVQRNNEIMLKRSMSAPSLCNSCFDDQLLRQQTSSILTTTAIIHVESGVRYKARKNNRDLPKDVKTELQGTAHLIRNLLRSKSWDASATVEFADRCCTNLQNRTVRRCESAPRLSTNVTIPDDKAVD